MDHVSTLLMMLTVSCSVLCGDIPAPVNLRMESQHFVYLLMWQDGPGSPAGLHYRVDFRTTNEDWMVVHSCVEVRSPLRCNLTDVFSDLSKLYYVNVTAVLGSKTSTPTAYSPFKPDSDTVPDPPSLRVSPCHDSLCVYLQSPSKRLDTIYKNFHYTLEVTNKKGAQFLKDTQGLDTVYLSVVPGLEYCVSVNKIGNHSMNAFLVCASKPAAVNNTDAAISVVLSLLVLGLIFVLLLFKRFINLKTRQPFVLSSFNAPYKMQLLLPTVESINCISLEPNTYDELINDEVDQEKEDEEVVYEGLGGCEEVCCEEISEDARSSLLVSPEIHHEQTNNAVIKTCTHFPGTFLKEQMLRTTPQSTSQILRTPLLSPKTPVQEIRENNLALHWPKRGDELGQQEEGSDDVNFFSLTLGKHHSEEQEKTEKEEQVGNVKKVKTEAPLFVLESPKAAMDIQPTYSENTDMHVSYSEEDTEEEEAFSGYMMRS